MTVKLELIFIHEICNSWIFISQDLALSSHTVCGHCTENSCQILRESSVDLQLSAEWHNIPRWECVSLPCSWRVVKRRTVVAIAVALCSQVQRDQGLAAPLALHWPVPTQQVTAETCPEVHWNTSEGDTGPGVQSADSDSDEVNNLAYSQPEVFKNHELGAKKSYRLKYWESYFPSFLYILFF